MNLPVHRAEPEFFTVSFPLSGAEFVATRRDGRLLLLGKDITDYLELGNGRTSIANLPEHHRVTVQVLDGTPGNPNRTFLTERGAYRLAMRSNKDEAEEFQEWLAEVAEQINHTGRYEAAPAPAPAVLSNRDLARMVIEEADRAESAEARVAELEPKALAHDTYLAAGSTERLVRQVAKLLGWTEKQLRLFLVEEKFIFHRQAPCGQSQWDHYADHREHFHPVEKVVEHSWGHCSHYTLYVTAAGIAFIQKRVAKRQNEMRAAIQTAPVG